MRTSQFRLIACCLLLSCLSLIGHPLTAEAKTKTKSFIPKAAVLKTPQSAVIDRLEACVNSSLILLSDVVRFRKTMPLRAQLDPLFSGTPLAAKGPTQATDTEITQYLIDDKIILELFSVKDGEVEQEINSIQSNNRIDRKGLRSALKEQGFTFDEYFQLIRLSLAKRSLIDRDIRTKVFISDDDVKNQFYNRMQKISGSFSYKIQIITVSPANYKTKGAALGVAQDALHALQTGESFSDVAKRVSDHPTASQGGDLGLVSEEEINVQIRTQVKKLRVGEISSVLGTESSGFFILKLVDVKTGAEDRLEKSKEEIRSQLATQEYQRQITLWLERQRLVSFVRLAGDTSLPGQYAQ